MSTTKKIITFLLVLVMITSFTACSEKSTEVKEPKETTSTTAEETDVKQTSTDEVVEIKFSIMNTTWDIDGWTAMVDAANAKLEADGSNVKIVINKVAAADWPEYYQKLVTEMAAGQAPDLARIANSFMPLVVSKGQAVDITEHVENDLDPAEYFTETFKGANYKEGRYYGLPSGVFYMVNYFNKNVFDAAGLEYPSRDWDNPLTFDQVSDVARTLTTGDGAEKQFGFYAGPYMAYIGMYTKSAGGQNVFNDDGTCALGDNASKEVYRWFDGMLRDDYSMPRPTDTAIMGDFEMFISGRIAMTVQGTWFQQAMQGVSDFNVGIAAVPSAEGRAYSSMFVDNFFIVKGTEHENEAWIALKALYSEEAFTALAQSGVGGLPINKAALDSNIDALIGENFSDEDKQCFIDGLDYVLGVPYNEYYEQADQKVNNAMDEWLLGSITSDEFAEKAAGLVDEEAKKAADK